MSYLDRVRGAIGSARIPIVYCTAIVQDASGRILFALRSDFHLWGLPGGIIEPGESPAMCVRRETLEETGLRVEPVRLTAVLSGPRHDILYPNGDQVQQTTFFFLCRVLGGTLQADREETTAAAFFARGETPPTLAWYQLALDQMQPGAPYFDPPVGIFTAPPDPPAWQYLRQRMGPEPLVLPGATAVIRNPRDEILLVRRLDSGLWMLPGGLQELGETLADAVRREVREETGLEITPDRICGAFGGHRVIFPNGDHLFPIATWFDCTAFPGEPHPDGQETDRVEYFPLDKLPVLVPGLEQRLCSVLTAPGTTVFS
jgi:ADP-ribose pyrophosphatase YjhB (NUDIX family)